MTTNQRADGQWEIIHMPQGFEPIVGPYPTKQAAEEDRVGMGRFFRHCDEPGFITSERK